MRSEVKYRIEQIRKGNIIKGYKKTAHRIMPNEWDNYTIGDIVKFEGGAQPPRSEFISYPKEGYIRLIQIRDYKTNEYLTFIPLKKARKFCTEDDVMIGRYGPPIFQILRGIKGAYNVALMKAIPAEDKLHKDYLYYYLQNETLFILIDKLSRRSSGQTGIDIEALNQFPFPLPPKNEQERIINIIKTWDKAIELKEKLIEEKKKQKNGLMQKLLTGKVRLPGFDGGWKEVKLGSILKERNETNYGDLELLAITSKNGVVRRSEIDSKDNSSEDKSRYKRICPLDIGYNTMRMWQGVSGVSKYEGIVSPAYTILKPTEKVNSYYIGYLFKLPRIINLFWRNSQGLTNDTLNLKYTNFKKIKVTIPTDIKEQDEIVNVLQAIDKSIEISQKEIEQLQLQKKGLMQLLLTGIVRMNIQKN